MNGLVSHSRSAPFLAAAVLAGCLALGVVPATASTLTGDSAAATTLQAWDSTHSHSQALVAVAGENAGTGASDVAIPFGVLKRADIRVAAVAAPERPLQLRPAKKSQPDITMTAFDGEHM
jgi:hypothetical protein